MKGADISQLTEHTKCDLIRRKGVFVCWAGCGGWGGGLDGRVNIRGLMVS